MLVRSGGAVDAATYLGGTTICFTARYRSAASMRLWKTLGRGGDLLLRAVVAHIDVMDDAVPGGAQAPPCFETLTSRARPPRPDRSVLT